MSVIVLVQGNPIPEKAETLQQYQQVARTVIAKHGGQPIARGSGVASLHGGQQRKVGIVVRFPDLAAAQAWYNDPDYQRVLPLRDQSFTELEINVFEE